MRIKQLECFIDLCRTTSLTKTAKNMHMAIASLSETIDRMESEVGYNLFEKTSRGYFINDKGEIFLRAVEPIVLQYQAALYRLQGYDIVKTIRVGIDPSIYPLYLSKILAEHQEEDNDETIELIYSNFSQYKERLLENKMDVVYCHRFSPLPKQLEFTELFENPICACMSTTNPLYEKLNLKLDDLIDQTIYYDTEFETTVLAKTINYLASKGADIKTYKSPDKPISMIEVQRHNGIMLMHKDKRDLYTGSMTLVPIVGLSEPFGLIYLKDREKEYLKLIDTMKKHL